MTKHHRERNLIRIRSALAVVALTAALSATGAAAASADDDDGQEYRNDHHVACSPYFGELEAETAEIEWGGAVCHNGPFDI
ncbi:hypothetical protein [Streptomyces luteogriseus]|uniref:hypothetical protein n=1 Tax=Streptomyces luteogriseus TaxID=68233 RepID=UPI002E351CB2|nr:hypothetical protein [Streptomyces luteogriseus]WTJ30938.1 hypothetical protein OID52_29760 [Streptomyces luteogriseus]